MKPIPRWHFWTFRRWIVQFRAWKISLKDSFRSGQLSSTNRSREKSEVFAKQFNTSYTSFMQHFHEHKKLSKLGHWVSHITVSQFNQRMAICLSLNSRQDLFWVEWSPVVKSRFSIIVFSENYTRKPELHAKSL